jgi:Wiskott-Aldrich syndrome protein
MSNVSEMIWSGTGWIRNPALPPPPPPEPAKPVPGFSGGCYVPPNVATTIPNAAITDARPQPPSSWSQSPMTPVVQQPTYFAAVPPSSVQAGMAPPQAPADGRPMTQEEVALVMRSRNSANGVVDIPAPPPPSRVAPPEPSRVVVEAPPPVAIQVPVVPVAAPDPIAEQIAKARAAAASGKL